MVINTQKLDNAENWVFKAPFITKIDDQSQLIIYSNGPKEKANDDDFKKTFDVRSIIHKNDRSKR